MKRVLVVIVGFAVVMVVWLVSSDSIDRWMGRSGSGSLANAQSSEAELSDALESQRVAVEDVRGDRTPWSSTPGARAHLQELGDALMARDSDEASRLVGEFFAGRAEAVERMIELMHAGDLSEPEVRALGALLKSASTFLVLDPTYLEPWTPDSLARAAVDVMGASDAVARMLDSGFDELGPFLDPARAVELATAVATRDLGDDVMAQVPALTLGKKWARTMAPDVEEALLAACAAEGADMVAQGHLVGMLLERDWRRLTPQIVELLREMHGRGDPDMNLAAALQNLAGRMRQLSPADRPHYFSLLAADPRAAFIAGSSLARADIEAILAIGGDATRGDPSYDALRFEVATDSDEMLVLGRALLESDAVDGVMARYTVGRLLRSDAASAPEFRELLEDRFEARGEDGSEFWGLFRQPLTDLADHQVLDGIVPWLEESAGDTTYMRTLLLAEVKARFATLAYLE